MNLGASGAREECAYKACESESNQSAKDTIDSHESNRAVLKGWLQARQTTSECTANRASKEQARQVTSP